MKTKHVVLLSNYIYHSSLSTNTSIKFLYFLPQNTSRGRFGRSDWIMAIYKDMKVIWLFFLADFGFIELPSIIPKYNRVKNNEYKILTTSLFVFSWKGKFTKYLSFDIWYPLTFHIRIWILECFFEAASKKLLTLEIYIQTYYMLLAWRPCYLARRRSPPVILTAATGRTNPSSSLNKG